jgi:hypothetical protein
LNSGSEKLPSTASEAFENCFAVCSPILTS